MTNWGNIFFGIVVITIVVLFLAWFFKIDIPDANDIKNSVKEISINTNEPGEVTFSNTKNIIINISSEELGGKLHEAWVKCYNQCLGLADYKNDKYYFVKDYYFEEDHIMCKCKLK